MKTPRELILERHRSAEAKLQRIRGEDLAACTRAAAAVEGHRLQPFFSLWLVALKFWEESIRPWRRIWIGMAAVWLVLLAVHLTTHERPPMARHKTPRPSPELLAALREQRQWMLQWLEPSAPPPAPRPPIPGPRSEQRPTRMRG